MVTAVLIVLGILAAATVLLVAMFMLSTRRLSEQRHRNAVRLARNSKGERSRNYRA